MSLRESTFYEWTNISLLSKHFSNGKKVRGLQKFKNMFGCLIDLGGQKRQGWKIRCGNISVKGLDGQFSGYALVAKNFQKRSKIARIGKFFRVGQNRCAWVAKISRIWWVKASVMGFNFRNGLG